jgi:hypothetical protein
MARTSAHGQCALSAIARPDGVVIARPTSRHAFFTFQSLADKSVEQTVGARRMPINRKPAFLDNYGGAFSTIDAAYARIHAYELLTDLIPQSEPRKPMG